MALYNVKIHLHIRKSDSKDEALYHTVKKLIKHLDARLVSSDATADVVVFHRGSTNFLLNAVALGKHVVSPMWLEACKDANQRLDVTAFLVGYENASSSSPLQPQLLETPPHSPIVPENLTSRETKKKNQNRLLFDDDSQPDVTKQLLEQSRYLSSTAPDRVRRAEMVHQASQPLRSDSHMSPNSIPRLVDVHPQESQPLSLATQRTTVVAVASSITSKKTKKILPKPKVSYLLDATSSTQLLSEGVAIKQCDILHHHPSIKAIPVGSIIVNDDVTNRDEEKKEELMLFDNGPCMCDDAEVGLLQQSPFVIHSATELVSSSGVKEICIKKEEKISRRKRHRKELDIIVDNEVRSNPSLSSSASTSHNVNEYCSPQPQRIALTGKFLNEEQEIIEELLHNAKMKPCTKLEEVFGRVPKPTHVIASLSLTPMSSPRPIFMWALAANVPILLPCWALRSIGHGGLFLDYSSTTEAREKYMHPHYLDLLTRCKESAGGGTLLPRQVVDFAQDFGIRHAAKKREVNQLLWMQQRSPFEPISSLGHLLRGLSVFLLGTSGAQPNYIFSEFLELLGASVVRSKRCDINIVLEIDRGEELSVILNDYYKKDCSRGSRKLQPTTSPATTLLEDHFKVLDGTEKMAFQATFPNARWLLAKGWLVDCILSRERLPVDRYCMCRVDDKEGQEDNIKSSSNNCENQNLQSKGRPPEAQEEEFNTALHEGGRTSNHPLDDMVFLPNDGVVAAQSITPALYQDHERALNELVVVVPRSRGDTDLLEHVRRPLKTTRGPAHAMKRPEAQMDTQQIRAQDEMELL